jgi:hypothetical protein
MCYTNADTRDILSRILHARTQCSTSTSLKFLLQRLLGAIAIMPPPHGSTIWTDYEERIEVKDVRGFGTPVPSNDSIEVETSCDRCRLLQPPWPIRIPVNLLFASGCPCCEFLRTILRDYGVKPEFGSRNAIIIDLQGSEMSLGFRHLERLRYLYINSLEGLIVPGA